MPTPCQNRGTCSLNLRSLGGYECSCADGYTGTNCELDVLECAEGECAIYKILLSIRGYSVMIRVCMQTSVQIRVRIMASVLNWRAVSSVTVRVDLVAIAVSTWTPVPHPTPVQLVSTHPIPYVLTHTPPHTHVFTYLSTHPDTELCVDNSVGETECVPQPTPATSLIIAGLNIKPGFLNDFIQSYLERMVRIPSLINALLLAMANCLM